MFKWSSLLRVPVYGVWLFLLLIGPMIHYVNAQSLRSAYLVTFEIFQTDIEILESPDMNSGSVFTEKPIYIKNNYNDSISIEMPVDKEFYNAVKINDDVIDKKILGHKIVINKNVNKIWHMVVIKKHIIKD